MPRIFDNIDRSLLPVLQSKMVTIRYKKYGTLQIQATYPRYSKAVIDEIDRVLAQHYGFTDEELEFIINYDIKYRLGAKAEE